MITRRTLLLAAGLIGVSSCTAATTPGPGLDGTADGANSAAPFPRTAAYYLAQGELPAPEDLARYDVVVLDAEWAQRAGVGYFTRLRELSPSITLLAYVDLIDLPNRLGGPDRWAYHYDLWRFTGPTTTTFPVEWLARTADGFVLSEYPDSRMVNLTDRAPVVDGRRFVDVATDWLVDTVWATGLWDGIFLDVWGDRIYSADRAAWDIDGDGVDEPDSEIYGRGRPWERGIDEAEQMIRERLPTAILVANGDRTLSDGRLNGRVWENFMDVDRDREPAYDLESYVRQTSTGGARAVPDMAMTIDRQARDATVAASEVARRGRYFLTATLLQNGFWAGTGVDYEALSTTDELDGGGLGPGYLGAPVVANPTWEQLTAPYADGVGSPAEQVYRRDFGNGVVLHNAGGTPREIDLGGEFRRIRGDRAPAVNDGAAVTRVTVGPRDGVVLLRPAP